LIAKIGLLQLQRCHDAMPEGPSIVILRDLVEEFVGRSVVRVEGNTKLLDLERMRGKKVLAFRSWGKHFFVCFSGFTLRLHFMLFGSYLINARKETTARLSLGFDDDEINFYACSVRYVEGDLDVIYDWSADVMSDAWDARAARRKLRARPDMLVCDALLDQNIFAGVGNIIKNEVLFRIRLHPESLVGALSARKLGELVAQAREYAFDFLKWKRAFVLRKHYLVHTRTTCPRCDIRLQYRAHLGVTKRRAFFCNHCQRLRR
jgi:endonuclease-8